MDQEQFRQLKRGNTRTIQKLCSSCVQQNWFIAYHMTGKTESAAPMAIRAWENVLAELTVKKDAPEESFFSLLSLAMFRIWLNKPKENPDFAGLEPPEVSPKYRVFTEQFSKIEEQKRAVYLMQSFGELSFQVIAKESEIPVSKIKGIVQEVSTEIMKNAKKQSKLDSAALLQLSTDFHCSDRRGTKSVIIPQFFQASLEHKLFGTSGSTEKINTGRESISMNSNVSKNKKRAKIRKIIITTAVICIVAGVGGFAAAKLAARNTVSAEITTTYNVEEITYGDVDSTISGSGTLKPITNETLSCENPCTVNSVSVAAGDSVSEGDTIAVVTETITTTTIDEETREMEETTTTQETTITAPCDGIVTEIAVEEDDSIEAGGEIAVVMGTDGFELQLSVDELDIANVSTGQEVTVTVDAVDGEYTGEVTNVSYNGTTSGSSTYYSLTAKIDYEEGIYSGMSASAEIVTESSGEGLLVPVSAVKTSGDDSYVTLAPSGSANGDSYEEDEIDADDLETVTVETGMSDGSYIMIESDELAEGDLIVVTEVSTTATSSDSSGSGDSMFGGGGMDFGNMDMGDFDPSNMPQGGGGMPSFGGNQ